MNRVSKRPDQRRDSASIAGWPPVVGGWGVPKSLGGLRLPDRWARTTHLFASF